MTEFERMTVENEIGMRKEDNPELFNSVYSSLFGSDYEDEETDDDDFEISDDF